MAKEEFALQIFLKLLDKEMEPIKGLKTTETVGMAYNDLLKTLQSGKTTE